MRNHQLIALISLVGFVSIACNLGAVLNPGSSISSGSPTSTLVDQALSSSTATSQATPSPEGPKVEIIFISQPETNSIVSSPLTISGMADSTFEQNLVIALIDESGNQLALTPTTIQAPLGERGPFTATLNFTIAAEQAGRISVYSQSAMTGGLEHLSSIEFTLIHGGSATANTVNTDIAVAETIGIKLPKASETISGGKIDISGFSDYFFESSLGIVLCGGGASGPSDELCGTSANILATGNALIASPDVGQAGPFSGSLTYSITITKAGRIVVFATSPRDGGIIHLSSIPVTLAP